MYCQIHTHLCIRHRVQSIVLFFQCKMTSAQSNSKGESEAPFISATLLSTLYIKILTSPMKLKLRQQIGGGLLIATIWTNYYD